METGNAKNIRSIRISRNDNVACFVISLEKAILQMLQILTAKKQLHFFLSLQDVSSDGSSNRFIPVNSSLILIANSFLVAFCATSHLSLHTIPYRIPRQLACLRLTD